MTNTMLAWACGMFILTVGELVGHYRPASREDTKPWVRYLRTHKLLRWTSKASLAMLGGVLLEWYLTSLIVPSLHAGPMAMLGRGVELVIGAGIGLSLGKHLSEQNYSMVRLQ